ncbi:MAG: signal peptidase II [Thermodesulfobacteriota bacterium]
MNWKTFSGSSKYYRLAIIAGLVVLVDQVSKAIILSRVPLHHSVPVIPGFFDITLILNPGGAFGFMAGQHSSLHHIFFLGFTSMAICFIAFMYRKIPQTHTLLATGFALILGGAVGNLMDRVRFERVVDFLDFYLGSYHWPAFNVADSAISVGMAIFIYHIVFNKMPE